MPTVIIPPTDVSPNTGTGTAAVLNNSPTLVTPNIGAATGTSLTTTGNLTAPDLILGTSGPSVRSSLGAKANRQGLVYDGTNWGTVSVTGVTGDFTMSAVVNLASLGTSGRLVLGITWQFGVLLNGLVYITNNTTRLDSTNTVPTGKWNHIAYTKSGTTGTFYINGITAGTVTDNLSYAASTVTVVGGSNTTNAIVGGLASPLIYNRALTAAEVVALYEAGTPSGADFNNASNTSKLTGANSDFSSAGNWTVAGATTISGGKLNLSNNDQAFCLPGNISIPVGGKFRVTLTVDSITAGAVQVYTGGVGLWVNIATSAGTYTQDFTFSATSGPNTALNLRCSGGNAVVDTVLYYQIGLLLAPDAQQPGGGTVWYDTSGNSANITLPASGVQWSVPTSGKIGNALAITNTTASTSTTTGSLVLSGGLGVAGRVYAGGTIVNSHTTSLLNNIATSNLSATGYGIFSRGGSTLSSGYYLAQFINFDGSVAGLRVYSDVVQIPITTASTSTTTGALQVAGGVGVAGAGYFGAGVGVSGPATLASGYGAQVLLSSGESGAISRFYMGDGSGWSFRIASRTGSVTTDRFTFADNGTLTVSGTTASTSFATGALTVAGGVGVAGAAYVGGNVVVSGGAAAASFQVNPSASTASGLIAVVATPTANSAQTNNVRGLYSKVTTAAASFTCLTGTGLDIDTTTVGAGSALVNNFGVRIANQGAAGITNAYGIDIAAQSGASSTNLGLRNAGVTSLTNNTASTSTTTGALQVAGGVGVAGAAFFGGAIAIGNTVNTVTPTLPNRTITIEIGGTVFYLHAKTTND